MILAYIDSDGTVRHYADLPDEMKRHRETVRTTVEYLVSGAPFPVKEAALLSLLSTFTDSDLMALHEFQLIVQAFESIPETERRRQPFDVINGVIS